MEETEALASIATLVSYGILISLLFATITYVIVKLIKWEWYKHRLKKINFEEYQVFGTTNGLPKVFQNKKNPNQFVFL